jgi:hypothetical protein
MNLMNIIDPNDLRLQLYLINVHTRKKFTDKQRNKFNAEYSFHQILIKDGWKGDELIDDSPLKKQYPYKTYIRFFDDDGGCK